MLLEIIEFFILKVAMPILTEVARKRDIDPVFKRLSDEAFRDYSSAVTTDARKAAVRKLYELQKS